MLEMATTAELVAIFGSAATAFSVIAAAAASWVTKRMEREKVQIEKQRLHIQRTETTLQNMDMVLKAVSEQLDRTEETVKTQDESLTQLRGKLVEAEERSTRHSTQLVNLDTRLTQALRIRDNALLHIWDREQWALAYWHGVRPDSLPEIPGELLPEIGRLVHPSSGDGAGFPLPMPDGVPLEVDADDE